jgi:hypothetical protein
MVDIVIFVEDKNDVYFFRDFILKNYLNEEIDKSTYVNEKTYDLKFENKIVRIQDTNKFKNEENSAGWTKIKGLFASNDIQKMLKSNSEIKLICIFDADESKSENINFKNTQIDSWIQEKDFTIDRFYMPFNDNNSHNLEQLLELSFNKKFKDCWQDFDSCVFNNNQEVKLPNPNKGKITTYNEYYQNLQNGDFRYLSEIWNLNSNTNENLKPLKEFLDQYLN